MTNPKDGRTVAELILLGEGGEVDRATVHRWLSDDPVFIATYNSYRMEMDAVRQEIRFLADDQAGNGFDRSDAGH